MERGRDKTEILFHANKAAKLFAPAVTKAAAASVLSVQKIDRVLVSRLAKTLAFLSF